MTKPPDNQAINKNDNSYSTHKNTLLACDGYDSLTFRPCGNSRVGFDDSNTLSGHRPLIISVPFFMLALGLQLVGQVMGGFIPAGFLECRFVNPTLGWPFLFDDRKGEYITLGGSL